MPTVDNRGVQIRYQVHGLGEPLVLIHGWSCEGRYWEELGFVSNMSDRFQVIIPDLRGHGESGLPGDRDFSDSAFASDVIAVMDDLGIDSAHIFGYSLGGWVAFELMSEFPQRVRSGIVGGAHPYEEDLSALREFSTAELVESWEALGAPLSADSKKRLAAMDRGVLVDCAPDRVDKAQRLDELKMPCLMVSGTEDWRFEDMRRFTQGNSACEFVAIEGLDHLTTWMGHETLLPPVLGFLAKSR